MSEELLAQLQAARMPEERTLLLVRSLLETLPADQRAAAWAAALPHWFDADILAALLQTEQAPALYAVLQTLPLVEPFAGRGHDVHELSRQAMLADWWQNRRDEYRMLSGRLADHFAADPAPEAQIEAAYHRLAADEDAGADMLWNLGADWNNAFRYDLASALAETALEHLEAGRLAGRGAGWALFWKGQAEARYYHHHEAQATMKRALEFAGGDRPLQANAIKCLGDVHVMLAEYALARQRYEAALPIYQEIGARLGEANAIRSLGDVAMGEEAYQTALSIYERAAGLYHDLGLPNDEADAFSRMANVYHRQKQYELAVEWYSRAVALTSKNAMWYRNRASEYVRVKNAAAARADLERAAQLHPDHPYLHLRKGDLAFLEKNYPVAAAEYRAFVEALPRNNGGHFGLGLVCLALSDAAEARRHYEQAVSLTTDRYDVQEALADLQDLLAECPGLPGGDDVLALLHAWHPL